MILGFQDLYQLIRRCGCLNVVTNGCKKYVTARNKDDAGAIAPAGPCITGSFQSHCEEHFDAEDMACFYRFGEPTSKKKVKCPILGMFSPESSTWTFAPASSSSASRVESRILELLQRECPDFLSCPDDGRQTNVSDQETRRLLVQNSELCKKGPTTPPNNSLRRCNNQKSFAFTTTANDDLKHGVIRVFVRRHS